MHPSARTTSLMAINTLKPPDSADYQGPPFIVVTSPAPTPGEPVPFRVTASFWPAPEGPVEFTKVHGSGFRLFYSTEDLIDLKPGAVSSPSFFRSPDDPRDQPGFRGQEALYQLGSLLGPLGSKLAPELHDLVSMMAEVEHASHQAQEVAALAVPPQPPVDATEVCYFRNAEDYYRLMLGLHELACLKAGVVFEAPLVLDSMSTWWQSDGPGSHRHDHLVAINALNQELATG